MVVRSGCWRTPPQAAFSPGILPRTSTSTRLDRYTIPRRDWPMAIARPSMGPAMSTAPAATTAAMPSLLRTFM